MQHKILLNKRWFLLFSRSIRHSVPFEWLYDEGADQDKQTYINKLAEIHESFVLFDEQTHLIIG